MVAFGFDFFTLFFCFSTLFFTYNLALQLCRIYLLTHPLKNFTLHIYELHDS